MMYLPRFYITDDDTNEHFNIILPDLKTHVLSTSLTYLVNFLTKHLWNIYNEPGILLHALQESPQSYLITIHVRMILL